MKVCSFIILLVAESLFKCSEAFAIPRPISAISGTRSLALKGGSSGGAASPFCIVVEAEIEPSRIDEFLDVIEKDAIGSRAEAGCLRFDVMRDQTDPNKFFFYEVC